MAQDLWAAFNPQPAPNTAAPSGPVLGPPPRPKDPPAPKTSYKTLSPEEAAAQGLDPAGVYQVSSEGNISTVTAAPRVVTDGKPTEYQMKSNQFYGRMLNAEKQFRTVPKGSRDARTTPGQWFHDLAPGLDATFNSSDRVSADNAARNWIAASLRQESGAAISPAEYENQYRIFFPMPGDTAQQIKEKETARKQAMLGFKTSAGQLAADAEKQYQAEHGNVMPWDIGATAGDDTPPPADGTPPSGGGGENPFTGLPGKSKSGPSDPIGEDPRFAGKRYNESGQEDPNGDFNAYGQYRDFRAAQASPDGALQGSVTSFEGQPQESIDNWTNWTDKQGRTRGPDGSILSGWGGPGTGGSYEGALQQELRRQGKGDPTSAENYIMRGAQGATFSLQDELVGAMAAAKGGMHGYDPTLSYQLARDLERSRQRQNEQGQGVAGYAAEIVPSLLTGNLLGDVKGAQNAMKVGAKGGGLYGFGSGQGFSDSTSRAGTGALGGAILGGGINQVGEKVVSPGLNALAQSRVGQSVKNAFTRAGGAENEIANAVNPAELIAAGKQNNVRVMTSDAFPPKTAVGKTLRMIGENIPFIGTGGTRAAQQTERAAAVSRFAKEFEVEGGTVDGVTKNLLKTRGKQIETLTTAKNAVIESVPGTVQTSNTLAAIDNKIAELTARNTETSRELAGVLKGMRKDFEGKTLPQLEAMRVDELSSAFKAEGMARIRDLGEKTMRSLYTPLKEDMGAFIKANGKPGDFNKWSMANKKLSDMMGDLKSSKFKNTLNNGATTPEEARKLLFSQTPSDVQRLVKELSPKGQAKARSAVVSEALSKATDDASGMVSPEKFLTAINALKPSTEALFKGEHGERLDGLVKLLGGTRRAGQTNAEIPNGLQATRFGVAGGAVVNPKLGVPAGLIARAYESPVVRDLLVRLGRAKAGSPAEAATQNRLIDIITRLGATRAPEAANDTLGAILARSPGSAAASDEENN